MPKGSLPITWWEMSLRFLALDILTMSFRLGLLLKTMQTKMLIMQLQ